MNTDKITTWSGLAAAVLGGLSATCIANGDVAAGKYLAYAAGVAFTIKSYFTNKPSVSALLPFLLVGSLLAGTGCQSLQDKWAGLSPATQNAAKAAAKLALSFGLSELGQSVKEVRPWQDKLQGVINTTFSKADAPEAIGAALTSNVKATVPSELHAPVLAKFKDALTNPKTTASAPGAAGFNAKIASKL